MVMYYALSGQTFFAADEVESLARKHLADVRVSVASKLRRYRPEVVAILSKMLRQQPEERYQTFPELAREIHTLYRKLEEEQHADG